MRLQAAACLLATASCVSAQAGNPVTGILGNASIITNNPPGAVYSATLPSTAFFTPAFPMGGNVKGSVYAMSSPDGVGVVFKVTLSGFPTTGGPFLYHIHDQPVPSNGNCTGTLAHLDPYKRGEMPACDATLPQTCQVGDLSGKHGKIMSDPFTATYTDDFATLVPGLGAYFGNRSITIHFANTTRITCANMTLIAAGPNAVCSGAMTSTITPSATMTPAANATTTYVAATPTSTFVMAAGNANAPAAMLALGAAAMAYLL